MIDPTNGAAATRILLATTAKGERLERFTSAVSACDFDVLVVPDHRDFKMADVRTGDLLISVLYSRRISRELIALPNLNFHFGGTRFRGVGGYADAILSNRKTYEVAAHVMTEDFDAGPLAGEISFPVAEGLGVNRLIDLTERNAAVLMRYLLSYRRENGVWPTTSLTWSGPLNSRTDLRTRLQSVTHPGLPELLHYYLGPDGFIR